MREIKFRAWDKKNKKMVSQTYIVSCQGNGAYTKVDIESNRANTVILQQEKNYVLMQFTGLKDKNGKEIYEGDIIEITNVVLKIPKEHPLREINFFKLPVIYDEKNAKFCLLDHGEDLSWWIFRSGFEKCEIIGNIYENPKLSLKRK